MIYVRLSCISEDAGVAFFDSCIGWRKIACTQFSQEKDFLVLY